MQGYTDGVTANGEVREGWEIDKSELTFTLLDVDGQGSNRVYSHLPMESILYFQSMLPRTLLN